MHNIQHQIKNNTYKNRYPEIFSFCVNTKPNAEKILSFGCSTGEEVETLFKIFKNSEIYGVEINEENKNIAENKFKDKENVKISKTIIEQKYDIIFCMSVFCKWPDTKNVTECSNIYPFNFFDESIGEIDNFLNIDGLLVIYNSNFKFEDSYISYKYNPIGDFNESGYVKKFDRDNKSIDDNYKNCVFHKHTI